MEIFNIKSLFSCFILTLVCIIKNVRSDKSNSDSLIFSQIIFMHGEHTPLNPYPTDPYKSRSFWPSGFGQLTEKGKWQTYSLGQFLRSRYDGFISQKYVENEVFMLSSDSDRAIISAELCLAGLYPNENGSAWSSHLNWQPVPIRTLSKEYDNYIGMTMSCPQYEVELERFMEHSLPMKRINEANSMLFKFLTQTTGINVTHIGALEGFYKTLLIEEALGLQIPEWATLIMHTPEMDHLYNLSFLVKTMTDDFKRSQTGPLINYLVQNIKAKISNSSELAKVVLLSGHQKTVVGIMNALRICFSSQLPSYSTAFILELHKQNGDYFLNILLRNETTDFLHRLILPSCDFDCPLTNFTDFVKNLIPKNWSDDCIPTPPNIFSQLSSTVTYWITAGTTFVVNNLATVGMYLVYTFFKKRTEAKNRSEYTQVGNEGEPSTSTKLEQVTQKVQHHLTTLRDAIPI